MLGHALESEIWLDMVYGMHILVKDRKTSLCVVINVLGTDNDSQIYVALLF